MVLLSDASWTDPRYWLAIAFGIIGSGIIAVLIDSRKRSRKLISFEVLSDAPVVNIDKRVVSKVKVLYDDNGSSNEINEANLVSLKVWNSGDQDVKVWNSEDLDVQDMEVPITFTFFERTVVSLTELKTDPSEDVLEEKNRRAYFTKPSPQPDSIGLPRCLLKPHQSISLSVLLKGAKGKIEHKGKLVNGQIIEFNPIERYRKQRKNAIIGISLFTVLFIISYLNVASFFFPILSIHSILVDTYIFILLVSPFLFTILIYTMLNRSLKVN